MVKGLGMEGHVIVCGYGIVGQKVVEVLSERNINFVVIELDPKKVEHLKELGCTVIEGDATYSRVLKSAGIENAKAIAIVLDDDAKNLFTVLAAHDLNKRLFITARGKRRVRAGEADRGWRRLHSNAAEDSEQGDRCRDR